MVIPMEVFWWRRGWGVYFKCYLGVLSLVFSISGVLSLVFYLWC